MQLKFPHFETAMADWKFHCSFTAEVPMQFHYSSTACHGHDDDDDDDDDHDDHA